MLTANTSARTIRTTPFTSTQWQELEHQALIFKYMVSGVPIPPGLIYSIKRSMESSFSSRLFPQNQSIGWGCFEMGFGRKVDPEPGRCRRTDGKKWRCSKEAYPDSKYCERHMHRGKNRSRKPVEVSSSATTTSNPTSNLSSISMNFSSSSSSSSSSTSTITSYSSLSSSLTTEPYVQHHPKQNNSHVYPFLNYSHSASSRPSGYGLSTSNNTTTYLSSKVQPFNQNDEVYSGLSSNRYLQGTKESQDELAFFPESSRHTRRLLGEPYNPLMGSNRDYSQPQYQGISGHSKDDSEQTEEQHCFILGTDFKSPKAIKADQDPETETQKHFHHFFGEWPPKNSDSWLDLASNSRDPNDD